MLALPDMRIHLNPDPAPGAGLAAAPENAATSPATPSVPATPAAVPQTEADFAKLASLSLAGPADPAATPASPAAPESPAAPATPPAAPGAVVQPPPPVPAASGQPDDDGDPSPEVLASLGDPGKRALQSEREKRKAASARLAEAQAELDRLKAQLAASAPAPETPPAAPATPPTPPAAAPSAPVPAELAGCDTFEQVVAVQSKAAGLAAKAMHVNTVLATEGIEAARDLLAANGVQQFQGVPLDELTAAQLAAGLSGHIEHGMAVQAQADRRKAELVQQRQSFAQACHLVPGLKDPNSASSKAFDALVAANPAVKTLGSNWPLLVAQQLLGIEAAKARLAPPATVPAIAPAAATPAASPPAAPRAAMAHVPPPSAVEALVAKVNNGTATEAEVRHLASLSLQMGDGRPLPTR